MYLSIDALELNKERLSQFNRPVMRLACLTDNKGFFFVKDYEIDNGKG